jgi:signal transduction histidine kinase
LKIEIYDSFYIFLKIKRKNFEVFYAKKIKIHTTLESIKMNAYEEELSQMVSILLDNAIKYSPEKSVVQVSLAKKRKNAVLTVEDEGIGIAQKDIPHIFDRFYRAENARERVGEEGGYGLGLAIAKRIVERYGGSICAQKKEKGACFVVVLPT